MTTKQYSRELGRLTAASRVPKASPSPVPRRLACLLASAALVLLTGAASAKASFFNAQITPQEAVTVAPNEPVILSDTSFNPDGISYTAEWDCTAGAMAIDNTYPGFQTEQIGPQAVCTYPDRGHYRAALRTQDPEGIDYAATAITVRVPELKPNLELTRFKRHGRRWTMKAALDPNAVGRLRVFSLVRVRAEYDPDTFDPTDVYEGKLGRSGSRVTARGKLPDVPDQRVEQWRVFISFNGKGGWADDELIKRGVVIRQS